MVAFNKKTEGGKQVSTHLSPRGNRTNSGQIHSAWVGVSAPKNAPTSLSATPVNTSVSISFTAPSDNGGMDITNYQYAISSNGGSSYSTYAALSPADAISPITVTGLTQNTAYLIKLKAVNDVGVSDIESSAVSFTTEGVPTSAPSGLSAIQTDTSVAISFTAAASSTSLTNYEYSFNNSTWTALSPADAVSPVTISGLSQNTAYNIYLRGVNSYGSGPGSTAVSFTTYGPPTGTTTISSVSSIGTTTATVNFSTTAGGGAITGYDYYISSWVNAGVSTSPINLSGLNPNTPYTVYVRPKNAYGVGPQSAGVAFSTLPVFMSASGGTTSDYVEGGVTYRAHRFTGTSTFTVNTVGSFGTVDTLVIAGAGSGGGDRGSGGGAGGMFTWTGIGVSATSYTVSVGGGGAGVVNAFGNYGTQSYFANGTYATTGGGAGCGLYSNGGNGGSGGGSRNTGGTGVSGQGNNGGSSGGDLGAGGGGAGGAGGSGSNGAQGAGRASTYLNGTSSTYCTGGKRDVQDSNYGCGGRGSGGGVTSGAGIQGLVVVRYRIA
jgi:hypothetical protein